MAYFQPYELFSTEDPLKAWEIGDKIGEGSFAVVHKGMSVLHPPSLALSASLCLEAAVANFQI